MRGLALHTVCEEAHCPNIGECFGSRTATFLILGNRCTRNCRFCAVESGCPQPLDEEEPERVAAAARELGLRFVVITSVTRDDLEDGGAGAFAATIRAVREQNPEVGIEVLVPDFAGSRQALATVLAAGPDVLNHNLETVARLYPQVRPEANYQQSLQLLRRVREMEPGMVTKSGIMVGVGERRDELEELMRDLVAVGCDVLTIGQYLSPSAQHLPVERYYAPAEFSELKAAGEALGLKHVEASPLVRSSYHAGEQARSLENR